MDLPIDNPASSVLAARACRDIGAFFIGVVCGSAVIPAVHWQLFSTVDPFHDGSPLCLHLCAFLLSFVVALSMRSAITGPIGLYAGLIGLVLVTGASEYPMASAIGLLIHGFFPAVMGSAAAPLLSLAGRTLRSPGHPD